jgi:hypothetical protein
MDSENLNDLPYIVIEGMVDSNIKNEHTKKHSKKNKVVMSHYPILFWNGQFRDTVHLYGHVHNSHQWNMCESWIDEARQLQAIPMRMYNVGCMMPWMNYTPRTLEEIIKGYEQYKMIEGGK